MITFDEAQTDEIAQKKKRTDNNESMQNFSQSEANSQFINLQLSVNSLSVIACEMTNVLHIRAVNLSNDQLSTQENSESSESLFQIQLQTENFMIIKHNN